MVVGGGVEGVCVCVSEGGVCVRWWRGVCVSESVCVCVCVGWCVRVVEESVGVGCESV